MWWLSDWLHLMRPALEAVLCLYRQLNTTDFDIRRCLPLEDLSDILFHELSSGCSLYYCVQEVGRLILWYCNLITQCLCCVLAREEITARGRKRRSFAMPLHSCSSSALSTLFSPDSVSLPPRLTVRSPTSSTLLLTFCILLSHSCLRSDSVFRGLQAGPHAELALCGVCAVLSGSHGVQQLCSAVRQLPHSGQCAPHFLSGSFSSTSVRSIQTRACKRLNPHKK